MTLDLIGAVIGLVYIWQEYKASPWLWITGVIMPVVYMFVYLEAGLYADFGMQVYYTGAAAYGLLVWKFGRKKGQTADEDMPITRVRRSVLLPSLLFFLIAWAIVWLVLVSYTNSTVPVADAFGNALSFVGLWWLARKYVEQWLIWVVVDAELALLYVYKGIPFTAVLYGIYVPMAVVGYLKWRRMMKRPNQQKN